MNLSELEKALLPIVCPAMKSLWDSTIFPAIQAALKSGSPEIQIVESGVSAMLNQVVSDELAHLAQI